MLTHSGKIYFMPDQSTQLSAISLKVDGLQSLVRQIGKELKEIRHDIEGIRQSILTQIASNDAVREQLRLLTEALQQEPEEGENLGKLLRDLLAETKALRADLRLQPELISQEVVLRLGGHYDIPPEKC